MGLIEDGKGRGYNAGVTSDNRVLTRGVVTTNFDQLAVSGYGFLLSTPVIDLTSSNPSALLYLKNNGDDAIIVSSVTFNTSKSKELSGTPNPIGTYAVSFEPLISSHDLVMPVYPVNLSGSTNTLDADVYSGFEGSSATSASPVPISSSLYQHGSIVTTPKDVAFFITKNSSAVVKVTPPSGTSTGNDKMQITISTVVYVNVEV